MAIPPSFLALLSLCVSALTQHLCARVHIHTHTGVQRSSLPRMGRATACSRRASVTYFGLLALRPDLRVRACVRACIYEIVRLFFTDESENWRVVHEERAVCARAVGQGRCCCVWKANGLGGTCACVLTNVHLLLRVSPSPSLLLSPPFCLLSPSLPSTLACPLSLTLLPPFPPPQGASTACVRRPLSRNRMRAVSGFLST